MTVSMIVRNALAAIGLVAVIAGAGAAAYFFGGYYSVAADSNDPSLADWALVHVREASIVRHASGGPPGSTEDPALVQAGARAYDTVGCVSCHGGPGVKPAPFSDGLNPAPNLKKVIAGLKPQEVFWVIKNGIKMTGMPSFGTGNAAVPDQEIWAIVAFLKAAPTGSNNDPNPVTAR